MVLKTADQVHMVNNLMDKESRRLGVTHQSIIKIWIDEKLKELPH
jgi:hypothetical protein